MTRTQLVMKALGSPIRREILWRVWEQELSVAEIGAHFAVSGPTLSGHLTVLRDAGLVQMRPEGTTRWYRANRATVARLRDLIPDDDRWRSAGDFPEQQLAAATVASLVVVTTTAPCSPQDAFRAFTDGSVYSRWLKVPVSIEGGHFTATMEWGTVVRGTYDLVVPPTLIMMTWDFQDDGLPLPGRGTRANLFLTPAGAGCQVELQQFVEHGAAAEYMQRAWRLVLGRFRDGVVDALDPGRPIEPRSARARR